MAPREREAIDARGDGGELLIVRDLLDKQLVDVCGEPMGRADGVVLAVPDGTEGQPCVAFIESGAVVLAGRVQRRLGRLARAIGRRLSPRGGRTMRIPWWRVMRVGIETEVDLAADKTLALAWEQWLLEHVVGRIPSLKPEKKEEDGEGEKKRSTVGPARPPGRVRGQRVRVHWLLSRKVVDSAGRAAGRVEEVRAHVSAGKCLVDEFVLGREGLMERLSVSGPVPGLAMMLLSPLGARHRVAGHHVRWEQMDLSDPWRPRLRCGVEELR